MSYDRAAELVERISLIAAHIDAATQEMLTLIRELDESALWYELGALSCAHLLN